MRASNRAGSAEFGGGERDLSDRAGSSSNAKAEADRPAAKFAKSKPLEFPGFY